jgi:hypothetical protein
MIKAGFVDPLKVVMAALLNTSRVASLLARCTRVVEASAEDEPDGSMDAMDGFNQSVGAGWISKTLFSIVLSPTPCIIYSSPLLILFKHLVFSLQS